MEIPVFVINLKRSEERRDHTTKKLNDLGIPFHIIEAVDGSEISDEEIKDNGKYGVYKNGIYPRYLLKEEIGCALSHLKIYRRMVDENTGIACILEDDNDYSEYFKEVLLNASLNINDWDLLYLGHHSGSAGNEAESRNKKQVLPLNFRIGEAAEMPFGSYGYILNLEAATKLLRYAFPLETPFDRYLGNFLKTGIRTFLLSPPCISQNSSFTSTINYDPKIRYATPGGKLMGVFLRKIYFLFPFMRTFRSWIYLKWNSVSRKSRKTGILKKHFIKI